MWPSIKAYLSPGWLAFHVAIWGVAIAMIGLGRWQLDVSNSKHFDLQNFGYAFQWWAFSAFAIFMWVRAIRDKNRPAGTDLVRPGGRFVVPSRSDRPVPDAGYVGPAYLSTGPAEAGSAPVLYRGYVMPQMATDSTQPGDSLHASYNDYLWQLALAEGADGGVQPSGVPLDRDDGGGTQPRTSEAEIAGPLEIDPPPDNETA